MRKILSFFTLIMLYTTLAFSQTRQVTGRVVDEAGQPVSGASILIRGSNVGASADANGNFRINAKTGDVLVITAVGAPQREVTVTSGSNLTVSLARESASLSEVVVTALGVRREARSTGYSVATIPTQNVTQARPTNVANGLTGKVSGLQINTVNNGVTADTRIVLRGERSILGNNQALVVLDNVPVSSDYLNSINPDDIDNVSILKGANAAALYGSDAANGVLLITTKRGARAKPSITFTHSTTIEKVSFFPELNTRFGAASTEADSLSAYTGFYGRIPYENQMYGPEYNGGTVALGYAKQFTRPDGSVYDTTNQISYDYKNPYKAFFQTGHTEQNGINFQSGDQNGSLFFSAQAVNISGTIPKDKSDRYTLRVGASRNYDKFSTSFSVGYTKFNTDITGVDYAQGRPVYWNVLNTPGEVPITNFKNLNAPFADENNWYNAYYPNPYWQINNSRVKSTRDDILGSLELGFKPTDWLNFTYRLGATATNYQQKNTIAGVTFSAYEISDPLGAGNMGSSNPNGVRGKLFDRLQETFILQSDFLINMEHKFVNDDLNVRLLLGNSINKNTRRTLQSGSTDINFGNNSNVLNELEIPGLYNVSNIVGVPTVAEEIRQYGKIGAYGSLQLGWKNFLFLEVTGRNDWVSVLAPENRSFFYPGVNSSFVFTDAIKSLKSISWLSFGKVLASWTKVGNVNVNPYQLNTTFGQTSGFPYGSLTGFSLGNTLANPGLTPEFVASREVGIQLGLFRNRANIGVTYFNENATNQTVPVNVSSSTGYTATLQNVGNVKNWGWEFDARITPLLNLGPVRFNMSGNLSLYDSKVLEVSPNAIFIGGYTTGAGIYTIKNQPMRVLQVIDWNRDSTGHVIVNPNTGRPTAASSVTNVGRSTPKAILGLNPSFEYKGLTLNILAEYRGGYNIYQMLGNAMAFTGVSEVSTATGRQRFVYPNSVVLQNGKYVPNTTVAIDNASNGGGFFAGTYRTAGTPFITSGDFWKIREVSLSYNIPIKQNNIVKRAVLGLVARNLFTFLPKDNVYADPEYSSLGTGNTQGISNENLSPPTRIFGATLTVGF